MTEKYSAYEKNAVPTLTMKIVFGISLTNLFLSILREVDVSFIELLNRVVNILKIIL